MVLLTQEYELMGNKKMKIYLIGLPSSGKTTLGKQLAASVKSDFIDMDDLIEKQEQKTIANIFAEKGEDYFREVEQTTLTKLMKSSDQMEVISTGGGVPCFFDNMEKMNKDGMTIYLKVGAKELVKRLKGTGTASRPLLKGKKDKELEEEILNKLKQREQFYSQAKHILDGDHIHVNDLINLVKYVVD
jgi:shikimate kinase